MPRQTERLIVGIGGYVLSIDPSSGAELWRTRLKGSGTVLLTVSGKRVFAGSNGRLFCLDLDSGEIIWANKLSGLGLGLVTFSGVGDGAAAELLASQQRAAGAAAAG